MAYHNERECSVDDLLPHLKEGVKRLLPTNEPVLICCELVHEPSDDEKMRNRFSNFFKGESFELVEVYYAYIVTPKRIIKTGYTYKNPKRGVYQENRAWPLVDVRNIREELRESGYMFWLDIDFGTMQSQGIPISFASKQIGDKFIIILKQAVQQSKKVHPINQSESMRSPEERLHVLLQLRNDFLFA